MFDWLRGNGGGTPRGSWDVAPSPDHTYVVFGDAGLSTHIAPALAKLDAALAEESAENRSDLDDPKFNEDFDDEGNVRAVIATHVTVEPVDDVAAARAATIAPDAFADATHAAVVRTSGTELSLTVPYALLAVAAAVARAADAVAYDTVCRRIVPAALVAEPLSGIALGSIGPHVEIVPTTDQDGTLRFTTVGLAKFGIFDVTLGAVPASQSRASEVVGAFVQSLVPLGRRHPGQWKPEVNYVSSSEAIFFFDYAGMGNCADKPKYFNLWAIQDSSKSGPWAIWGRNGPLGAKQIAEILAAFDKDRAAIAASAGHAGAATP